MSEEQVRQIAQDEISRTLGDYSNISRQLEAAIATRIFTGKIIVAKITIDIASASASNSSTTTTTVYGASVGDAVVLTPPAAANVGNTGSLFMAYVSASNTVTIKFINPEPVSALNPGAGEFTIVIIKQ